MGDPATIVVIIGVAIRATMIGDAIGVITRVTTGYHKGYIWDAIKVLGLGLWGRDNAAAEALRCCSSKQGYQQRQDYP